MRTKLLWLIFILGFILGPLTHLGANYLFGDTRQTLTLKGPVKQPWGSIQRLWQTPVFLRLDPSMNPIAFELDYDIVPRHEDVDIYRAELFTSGSTNVAKGARPVWSQEWRAGYRFTPGGKPAAPIHSHTLKIFDIPQSGDYQLHFTPVEENHGIDIRELTLNVKANVAQPNPLLLILGYLLFLGPIIHWVFRERPHSFN